MHVSNTWKKWKHNRVVRRLCIDFKKAHLVTMEILYNKLFESDTLLKPVMLIKLCLNEAYS